MFVCIKHPAASNLVSVVKANSDSVQCGCATNRVRREISILWVPTDLFGKMILPHLKCSIPAGFCKLNPCWSLQSSVFLVASSPSHSQILSHSRGEKLGEDLGITSPARSFTSHSAFWSGTGYLGPFAEKVLKDYYITISSPCLRQFHDIYSNDLKWSLDGRIWNRRSTFQRTRWTDSSLLQADTLNSVVYQRSTSLKCHYDPCHGIMHWVPYLSASQSHHIPHHPSDRKNQLLCEQLQTLCGDDEGGEVIRRQVTLVSFEVKWLFTDVPVDEFLGVVHKGLMEDDTLMDRTGLLPQKVTHLLELCLQTTYFKFQGSYYEQTDGAAMGSPESPVVTNIYMEMLEQLALRTATHPPQIWRRYVDDTFRMITKTEVKGFLNHLNSLRPTITFTVEQEATVPGHTPSPQEWWIPWHKYLQKAHPHRPISELLLSPPKLRERCCLLPLPPIKNHC